jgi:HK97 family phage portal protein
MDILTRGLRGLAQVRSGNLASQFGDSSIPPNSAIMGVTASGFAITEAGSLAIATVMNCVKVLHNDITLFPFAAMTGEKTGVHQVVAKQPLIVTRPFGPELSTAAGMGQIVVSLALRGNAFLFVVALGALGFPTQVQVIHPDLVQVKRDDAGVKCFKIRGKVYYADQIKHITGVMLPGSLEGMDPITYQRTTLGLASDVNQYAANFFSNGATPGGIISVPGQGGRAEARQVKEAWEAGHSGVPNAHRPGVMFGGATWQALSVAPENAQFLQTRAFLREEICGWLGVPLQRIQAIVDNASQGGGKGLDSIDQGYATHTLQPITIAIEQVWDEMIPGADSTWSHFDFRGLLRAIPKERAQIAQIHRLIGVRNRNQIRADEGWAPIEGPDGEDYNLPFNTNSSVPPLLEDGITGPPDSEGAI